MADKVYRQTISSWVGGINTLNDPYYLMPNSDKETTAELIECENFDINAEGALITSKGYEQVSAGAGLSGGAKMLLNYEKDDTNRYLIIAHDDDLFYITPSSTTWTSIGDYGTAGTYLGATVFKGTTAVRRLIMSCDQASSFKKWDGTTFENVGADNPTYSYIMTVFQGRLFCAYGSSLYYTDVEDETDFTGGGVIGFNDIITGLKAEAERLVVFTKTYNQGIYFQYNDTSNVVYPVKEPYERDFGCLAPKSIQRFGNNLIYWAEEGVFRYGTEENYPDVIPRSKTLSAKIDNDLRNIKKTYRYRATSVYKDQKYYLAVPYDSLNNDRIYVYNTTWDCWTVRSGIYPSDFALFRNSNYDNELYFTDTNNAILYKFNESYNYAGSGYNRKIKSKKHIQGDANRMKRWHNFIISGEIYSGTIATLRLRVDNATYDFTIDNDNLVKDLHSNYLGQDYLGKAYLGGSDIENTSFKRFLRVVKIPQQLKEGYFLQYEIFNNSADEPIKIDYISFDYSYLPKYKIANKFTT